MLIISTSGKSYSADRKRPTLFTIYLPWGIIFSRCPVCQYSLVYACTLKMQTFCTWYN